MAGWVIKEDMSGPKGSFHTGAANLSNALHKMNEHNRVMTLQLDGDELAAALWGLEQWDKPGAQVPPNFDIKDLGETLQTLIKLDQQLRDTILKGWPHEEFPTAEQAKMIEAVYHELSIYAATETWFETSRWYLAGQIVARIFRDVKE